MSIRSYIANKLRSFTGAVLSEEDKNNNVRRSVENESIYSLALTYFNDIKGRVDQVYLQISSKTSFEQIRNLSGRTASDDQCCIEKSEEVSDSKWKPGCLHKHHSSFSSWDHALSVHCSHVPPKLQEPYIEHGYLLPFMPWRYYLKALYTPGYELMNIWTHLIPSLYFMYLLMVFAKEFDIRIAWPLFTITLCASIVTGLSALAHMFHARSSLDHSCWFMVDYFGINVYAFATIVCSFYTGSLLEYYNVLSRYYLPIAVTICSFGFFCLCITQTGTRWASIEVSRKMKVYVNGFGYLFGAVPLLHRMGLNKMEGREELALWYHALAMITLIVAPVIYSTDFPQKYWPGRCNVFGHSHQIFHLLTASAAYFLINAIYHDTKEGPWGDLHQQVRFYHTSKALFSNILMFF